MAEEDLTMSAKPLPDFKAPDTDWISDLAEDAGISKPRDLARQIAKLMREEKCNEEVWTAVKQNGWGSFVSLSMLKQFHKDVLKTAGARREHSAQWLPPSLVACAPRTLARPQALALTTVIAQQPDGKLLSLPAELRVKIYEQVLKLPSQTTREQRNTAAGLVVPGEATQPALTRTCRQTRSEMLPSFYENSTFVFHIDRLSALNAAKRWIEAIGIHHVGLMRSIVLHGFQIDSANTSASMRPARIGIDLGNLTAKTMPRASPPPGLFPSIVQQMQQMKQQARIEIRLNDMALELRGKALGAEGLVGLLVCFAKGIADTQTEEAQMLEG
ncbi:hypothetical protein LTR85_001965 [Meristemomyces frigidus]|nr:hypothetical protein LTR85_001965 [Meristemomyces frigidus]